MTELQIEKLQTYYKARYNEEQLPVIFEKYVDGVAVFRHEYVYTEKKGLEKIIYTDKSGDVHEIKQW